MSSATDWSWIDPVAWGAAWDVVVLGGYVSPGVAELTGCERGYKWDSPKGSGTSGGSRKFKNEEDADSIKLKLRLWKRDQFPELERFLSVCRKAPDAKEPTALEIEHPEAARHGISAVVVTKIGQLLGNAREGWTVEIGLAEYRKPVPVAAKNGGAVDGSKAWDQVKDLASAVANSNAAQTAEKLFGWLNDTIGPGGSGGQEWMT